MEKKQLRKELKSLRNQLSEAEITATSTIIVERILQSDLYKASEVLFGYLAFKGEVNIDEVLLRALADGKKVCVPFVVSREKMQAVQFVDFAELVLDRYGIRSLREPVQIIEPLAIDLALISGVGFAEDGRRLGMGAGYYDRFLPQTNAIKVGIIHDILVHNQIPTDNSDVGVDYLITETKFMSCT